MAMIGASREPVYSAYITWGDPLTAPQSSLGQLHFDAVLTEDHERTTEVTEHPVEQGTAIVDHVRPLAHRVRLTVFVSNTPVYSKEGIQTFDIVDVSAARDLNKDLTPDQFAGGLSGLLDRGLQAVGLQDKFPTQLSVNVLEFDQDFDFVKDAFDIMTELRDTATLLQVATPRQLYVNMILKTINMHRDPGTGTSANFELEFQQIRVVDSNIVDAPLPSVPRATPGTDTGKKDTKKADGAKKSVLLEQAEKSGINVDRLFAALL
jgi:hypothetical protein